MITLYFIKIKKDFLLKPEAKKTILLLWYLFSNEKRSGSIDFVLNDMIKYFGYCPSNKPNGINSVFKNSLQLLINENIIYSNNNLSDLKNDKTFVLNFSKDNNNQYSFLDVSSDYVVLNNLEFDKIMNYQNCIKNNNSSTKQTTHKEVRKEITCNVDNIIYLYLILKSFMNFSDQSYQFCFPSVVKLKTFSGLSAPSVKKILEILQQLNMIYIYNLGKYITPNGTVSNNQIIYSLNNLQDSMDELKLHFVSLKKDFCKWEE